MLIDSYNFQLHWIRIRLIYTVILSAKSEYEARQHKSENQFVVSSRKWQVKNLLIISNLKLRAVNGF